MSDALPPDPKEHSFAESLRDGVKQLREQRGPCPSSDELVAFFEGRLAEPEASRIRDHVEACGLCDVQLGRLEGAKEPAGFRFAAIWTFLRKPAVPYALLLVLAYPAYRGLLRPPKVSENEAVSAVNRNPGSEVGVASVPNFSLDAIRSPQAPASSLIQLSGREKFFLLSFLIPMKPPPYRYELVVLRGDGTVVASAQELAHCDGVGNCSVICNAALFFAGKYELAVTETAPAGSRKIVFPFQVAR